MSLLSLTDILSGAGAGMTMVITGQPFDMVKVQLQNNSSGTKLSPGTIVKDILKNEGITAFWKGTTAPLILSAFYCSVSFTGNEITKKIFQKRSNTTNLELWQYMVAGAVGGTLYSPLIGAGELFRIKIQIQDENNKKYNGSGDCAKQSFNKFGIKSFTQGLSATLLREGIGNAFYFGSYEYLKSETLKKRNPGENLRIYEALAFGAVAGISMWGIVYPFDTIKSLMQTEDYDKRKYSSVKETSRIVYKDKGLGGFYKGYVTCMIRAPVANSFAFLSYEIVRYLRH